MIKRVKNHFIVCNFSSDYTFKNINPNVSEIISHTLKKKLEYKTYFIHYYFDTVSTFYAAVVFTSFKLIILLQKQKLRYMGKPRTDVWLHRYLLMHQACKKLHIVAL